MTDGAIQRVRYTGQETRILSHSKVHPGGIELGFNFKLDPATAAEVSRYQLEQWNYKWQQRYGSDQWSPSQPDKKGRDPVQIQSATLSPDGKKVFLKIPGIHPVNQVHGILKLKEAGGDSFEEEFYMTINKVPARK